MDIIKPSILFCTYLLLLAFPDKWHEVNKTLNSEHWAFGIICQKWFCLPALLPTALIHREKMLLLPVQMCSQSVGVWPDAPTASENSLQQQHTLQPVLRSGEEHSFRYCLSLSCSPGQNGSVSQLIISCFFPIPWSYLS